MKNIRILWISPTLPIPITAGNRRHLHYLISLMQNENAIIDFVLYGWETEASKYNKELTAMFNRFFNIPQLSDKMMSFGDYWGIDDWVSKDLLFQIKDLSENNSYDAVFVEYVWLSKVLELFGDNIVKVIDTHDKFSERDSLLESQGIRKQWYYTRKNQEAIGIARADIVLGITSQDCEHFKSLLSLSNRNTSVINIGTGVNTRKEKPKTIKNNKISFGYIASSNAINIESSKRFFTTLNSFATEDHCFFNVGGSISDKINEYKNVKIYKKGYINNIKQFYNEVDFVVAPMIEGTGLKIKSIEAIEYNKPLMATMHATSDLPVSSLWHNFPNVESFAKFLGLWITKNPSISKIILTHNYLSKKTNFLLKDLTKRQLDNEKCFINSLKILISKKQITPNTKLHDHNKNNISIDSIKKNFSYKSTTVTVIIPVFNTESYIERCLDSILADDLKNVEIIVVDDGSTDKSPEIIKHYAKHNENIIFLQQPNSGQGVARNKGIDLARGEYLYFVDSDDYLGHNSLYHMYNAAKSGNIDICSPDRIYLSERPLQFISALPGWCCFIKKDLLNSKNMLIRQPKIRSGQDGVFSNLVLTQCKTCITCHDAKYYYEKRNNSTFNSLKNNVSIIPNLVEQHLSILRYFYKTNNLFMHQGVRYLLFIQDETYKWRYKNHLKNFNSITAKNLYLIMKSEICTKIHLINNFLYFSKDFLDIAKFSYEEHREMYG